MNRKNIETFGLTEKAENYLLKSKEFKRFPELKIVETFFQKYLPDFKEKIPCNRIVHITGTNGKGSTTFYLSQYLQQAGYKCFSFFSPHVSEITERMLINQEKITIEEMARCIEWVEEKENESKAQLSFFEIMTMAFAYYCYEQNPDYILLEVGLGGRLDATKVFGGETTVLTNISLDHTKFLSDDPKKILWEKAQLLIPKGKLITGELNDELKEIAKREASEKEAQFFYFDNSEEDLFMKKNETLAKFVFYKLTGLTAKNIQLKNLPGRIQKIDYKDKKLVIDGSHNEAGNKMLVRFLKDSSFNPDLIVISILRDKKWFSMSSALRNLYPETEIRFMVLENYPRSNDVENIEKDLDQLNISSSVFSKNELLKFIETKKQILLCGSLYFAGEVINIFKN